MCSHPPNSIATMVIPSISSNAHQEYTVNAASEPRMAESADNIPTDLYDLLFAILAQTYPARMDTNNPKNDSVNPIADNGSICSMAVRTSSGDCPWELKNNPYKIPKMMLTEIVPTISMTIPIPTDLNNDPGLVFFAVNFDCGGV